MSPDALDAAAFSPDVREFLALLHQHGVRYLIVGGEAVIYHGYARLTGDVDFFYASTPDNARRLFAALQEFWAGNIPGLGGAEELEVEKLILQFGRPPNRIDLINRIDGVAFEDAWPHRITASIGDKTGGVPVLYIDLDHLIANKEAAARPKDLDDLQYLHSARRRGHASPGSS
jgi:predicted nucleotidyltransferase